MFDPATDPLGTAVQARARAMRFQDAVDSAQHPTGSAPTMLPDPQWDGFFQASNEAAGGLPTKFGYALDPAQTHFGLDPSNDIDRDPATILQRFHALPTGTGLGNTSSNQLGTKLGVAVKGLQT